MHRPQPDNSNEPKEDLVTNLSSGDLSLVDILHDLQKDDIPPNSPPLMGSTSGKRTRNSEVTWETSLKEVKTLENGRLKGYFCSDVVFNLSHKVLTDTEISVLNKGLGFSPTPFSINEHKLRNDFNEFCRRMRCKWYFRGSEVSENFSEIPSFRKKSTWIPPKGSASLEVFLGRVEDELFSIQPRQSRNLNLTKEEWSAVKSLKEDKSIVIKPADKGSCVVVWDKQDYIREVENQLGDEKVYEETTLNNKDLSGLMNASNNLFKKLRNRDIISEKELKYFLYDYKNAANLGKLYLLPKIHKRLEDVPGRPVISNCGAPTEKVSEFLDYHLKPVMKEGESYIRDSSDFLSKIKALGKIPEGSFLVTCDVVGLYPSIPHSDGLRTLERRLKERTEMKVPTEDLVEMANFVLKNNVFEFADKVVRQTSGTAIGTKFAPPYACIFMDQVEKDFLEGEVEKPYLWVRYIDDIFLIWTHGRQKLEGFLERLNVFHDSLKFTWETSQEKVIFLDVVVRLREGELETELYCKPTDCHQYLHYKSCHPAHMKRSSVFSQGLRIKRICSKNDDCQKHLKQLGKWFRDREYPKALVDSQIERISKLTREEALGKGERESSGEVPFVIDYHPSFNQLGGILRRLFVKLDKETKNVFTRCPFVAFRSPRNLRSHLVRAKVILDDNRRVGCMGCGNKRCLTCPNIVSDNSFTSKTTNRSYFINHNLNCNSRNLIYLLSCKICHVQYVGQTTDKFRFRWNNYKSCQRKAARGEECPQLALHKHFLGEGHNGLESDCEIRLIDKSDPSDPTSREAFWIDILGTLHPGGLNCNTE